MSLSIWMSKWSHQEIISEFIVYVGREGKETRRALDANWKLY